MFRIIGRLAGAATDRGFRWGQIGSASLVSLAHGTNDAQKTMGVITLALIASGHWTDTASIPFWVKLCCALAISLGTYFGGWRIIRTVGKGLVEISSPQGMAAETSSAAVILASSHLGFPLSTTQVATGSVLGSGLGRPGAAVRWGVAGRMVVAWCSDDAGRGRGRRGDVVDRPPGRGHRRCARDRGAAGGLQRVDVAALAGAPVNPENVNDAWPEELAQPEQAVGRGKGLEMWDLFAHAAWRVTVVGLVLGRGRPAFFAPRRPGDRDAGGTAGGSARRAAWLHRALGLICFAVVLAVVAWHHHHRGVRTGQGGQLRATSTRPWWTRAGRAVTEQDAAGSTAAGRRVRALGWLRAGYPEGVPQQDYVALLGVLRRSLAETELEQVVGAGRGRRRRRNGAEPATIDARIADIPKGPILDADVVRVSARLAAAGWPLAVLDRETQAAKSPAASGEPDRSRRGVAARRLTRRVFPRATTSRCSRCSAGA